jgi:hypothetical protein
MANDSYTQQALGRDPNFHTRIRANLMAVAWQVIEEAPTVPDHAARATFAHLVISAPDLYVPAVASWIVIRPNLIAFETSYSFAASAVVTASGDPDIQSQLMTDWNDLAGIVSSGARR